MPTYLPLRDPGTAITARASTAITAGQLVEITGDNKVGPAGAGSTKVRGVAATTTPAGELLTVRTGGDHILTAEDTIAAGDQVTPGANGTIAKGATPAIGVAVVGGPAPVVELYR